MKIFQQLAMRLQQNPKQLVETYDYVETLLREPNQVFILVGCRLKYIFVNSTFIIKLITQLDFPG